AGHLAGAGDRLRGGQHDRRSAVRAARPARQAGEPGAVSTVASASGRLLRTSTRGLRATGWIGYACIAVLVLAAVIAVVGSLVAPYDPNGVNLSDAFVGPTGGHLLGFDPQGRDLLSRLLVGARTSMLGPLAVVVICMTAGALLAVSAAWRRGAYDAFVSSGLDILFAFPGILLAVLAATVFGAG